MPDYVGKLDYLVRRMYKSMCKFENEVCEDPEAHLGDFQLFEEVMEDLRDIVDHGENILEEIRRQLKENEVVDDQDYPESDR